MLEVIDIHKIYENQFLLKGVSFQVKPGETVCLLGPSGSGKSTLLRIIAGLETCEKGNVIWNGADLADIPVHKRGFGLMFQDYALFPHKSVFENVAFGLKMQGLPSNEIRIQTMQALDRVNMAGFANRNVTDLSGGEQQRVALARALAPRPGLLMLDEPLGALDRALRSQLSDDLRSLLHAEGIPVIYVTHDQEEAFTIADRLILLNQGKVEQEGTPAEVYKRPANSWVARFMGMQNLLSGVVQETDPLTVATDVGAWLCADGHKPGLSRGEPVTLLFRPDGARLSSEGIPEGHNRLQGKILDAVFYGEGYRVDFLSYQFHFRFLLKEKVEIGAPLNLFIEPQFVQCL